MYLATSEGKVLLHPLGGRQGNLPMPRGKAYITDEECGTTSERQSVTADELHSWGLVALLDGNSNEAIDLFRRAIGARPGDPILYNNCGEAYRMLHQYGLALTLYEEALTLDPLAVDVIYNLGLALQMLGRNKEAAIRYEQALVTREDFQEAHNNLGVVLHRLGCVEDARLCYERALRDNPYSAEAHNNLGIALKSLGSPGDAVIHHQTAMRLKPGDILYRAAFVDCLANLQLVTVPITLRNDLIAAFSHEGLDLQDLAYPGSSLVTHSGPFRALVGAIDCNPDDMCFEQLWAAGLSTLHADPLFMAILQKSIIRDHSIERVLTQVRRALLHLALSVSSGQPEPTLVSFIYALAVQCFNNGYVYAVSDQELTKLVELEAQVGGGLPAALNDKSLFLGILACYIPMSNLVQEPDIAHLTDAETDIGLRLLIAQQVFHITEERRLRTHLKAIGVIDDEVSRAVRAQYEEHPYPLWLYVQAVEQVSLPSLVADLFPQVSFENGDTSHPDILVPGCGTGQQAIRRSIQIRGATVLGVDLSLSSLSYAKRKALELNIDNVEFMHADILNLRALVRSFDLIECIGVLHHMQDPVKGWRVLADLLKPGGVMRIGLYSESARKNIVAAQLHVARKGYTATPDGIRRARQDIFSLPNTDSLAQVVKIKDFYTMPEARDLLFHVRETQFTLLQIAEILDDIGVTFLGFEHDNAGHKRKYLDKFPEDQMATSLRNWHIYEQQNPNTFLGLYIFWVRSSPPIR